MSLFASPLFLRRVLLADSASCVATGALQLAFTEGLSQWLRLPAPLLATTGVFLLAYAVLVGVVATRRPIPRGWVWLFVIGNAGWALGCIALLAGGVLSPSTLGIAWIGLQVACVAVLAELQWMALRARPQAAFA